MIEQIHLSLYVYSFQQIHFIHSFIQMWSIVLQCFSLHFHLTWKKFHEFYLLFVSFWLSWGLMLRLGSTVNSIIIIIIICCTMSMRLAALRLNSRFYLLNGNNAKLCCVAFSTTFFLRYFSCPLRFDHVELQHSNCVFVVIKYDEMCFSIFPYLFFVISVPRLHGYMRLIAQRGIFVGFRSLFRAHDNITILCCCLSFLVLCRL